MTPVLNGRRGWVTSPRARRAAVALCLVLALTGCASKKKPRTNLAPGGGAGLGEEGLGGRSGSSHEQFQHGTLGAGGGPLTDIHFDLDEFTIRPQDSEILRSNAEWLSKNGGARVQVEGHCDERGSEEYNIALGAKRAQAAKDYLVTLGISGGRVSTISYGKELPLCNEHNESCWEQNRRDHFVVSQ